MKGKNNDVKWDIVDELLQEMIVFQRKKLLACGRQEISHLTEDDILQPNDFPKLEFHPVFRYEEGLLAGIQSVQTALLALRKDYE